MVLDEGCWPGVEAAQAVVEQAARGGAPVYGINTGFGKLATVRIAPDQIEELQRRLVLSHMCGVGPPLPDPVVRLVLALKAASLARGHSGVRRRTIELLLALLAHDALPVIPAKGSVGASGDLAPLAHLAGALIGVGEVRLGGAVDAGGGGARPHRRAAADARGQGGPGAAERHPGLERARADRPVPRAAAVFDAALVAGAMSVDAALGSDVPFDPRLNAVRGQPAQVRVAARLFALLAGSAIRASHREECERVQDPYSLRCQPQVMGACLELLDGAAAVLEREANGVSDNPLVFARATAGAILSGGNFHGEPVALAADQIALALAEIGSLAERRIALLTDPDLSQLPAFLTPQPGLNSGFMLAADRGRGARQREPAPRPPGRDRQPADLGQSGGPRQHGDLRGAPPARDDRQRRAHRRDRAARRGPGHRAAPAAARAAPRSRRRSPRCARTPRSSPRPPARRRDRNPGRGDPRGSIPDA